jgi:trans-aconitate methyltransferase
MISAAQSTFPSSPTRNCTFHVQDCTTFSTAAQKEFLTGKWDKVFSNAALHWILRKPSTRLDVLRYAYTALKPGGTFAFEMGGYGNVAGAHTALIAALIVQGLSLTTAREKSPWFFPSGEWMRETLTSIGFEVKIAEIEYRPTRCTERDSEGKGGLEGWVRLMGAPFLEGLEQKAKDEAVKYVCEILEESVTREDGSQWLGYIRLRVVARKPVGS